MNKMKIKLILLTLFIVMFSMHFVAAGIDVRLTGSVADVSSTFYTETDSTSLLGYDGNDVIAPSSFPSGNSSSFYSTVGSNHLAIDSWPLTSAPRTWTLTYEMSPGQTGTLDLSWTVSGASGYSVTLYSCSDSGCSSKGSAIDMNAVSTTSVSVASTKAYFQLVIAAESTTTPGGGTTCTPDNSCAADTCSDSTCVNNCGTTLSGTKPAGSCSGLECGPSSNGCGSCGTCASGDCVSGECVTCIESWSCTGFGACINGVQTQTCTDSNSCGTTLSKPTETQFCISPTCTTAADCNDGNSCTDNSCVAGSCVYTNNQNSCNDGDSCTTGDKCSGGSCSGTSINCPAGKVCSSGACVAGAPPNTIPTNLQQTGEKGCSSDFTCGSWGKCEADYNVLNLINIQDVKGTKNRLCVDNAGCYSSFYEKENCSLKEEVLVVNKVWCNQEYTEILNKDGTVVARLKPSSDGKFTNVALSAQGDSYCAYCFDNVKNFDETDVDCGGSCSSCADVHAKPSIDLMALIIKLKESRAGLVLSLVIFSALLVQLFFFGRRLKSLLDKEYYGHFLGEYHKWKHQGYDVSPLTDDINRIARAHHNKKPVKISK